MLRLILLLTGLATPALGAVTVETCGRPLLLEHAPRRAVVHGVAMGELAFALHLQPDIVGVTGVGSPGPAFRSALGTIPVLTPGAPTLDALTALRVDVLLGWGPEMPSREALAASDIAVFAASARCDPPGPATLDRFYRDTLAIGRLFDVADEAEDLVASWKGRVARIAGLPRVPVQLPEGKFPFATSIVEAAGGSVWEAAGARDPQVVILVEALGQDGRKQRAAVRAGKVFVVRAEQLEAGPAAIEVIEALARLLRR